MKTATLALSLFALATACVCQQPAKTPPKEPFVVDAGEVVLTALIDRCAAYLDCNILVNPQELQQGASQAAMQVRLQKRISTDTAGCEEFLAGMLFRCGFALTQVSVQGPTWEILSLNGARSRELGNRAVQRTPEEVLARPDFKSMCQTVLPLQHVNAVIATNSLRPFFASSGAPGGGGQLTVGNAGNNAAVLLLGMQDQVAQAIRLIRACDLPGSSEVMPGVPVVGDDRIASLERRVRALEEQLGRAKPTAEKPAK